jgi:hypothetical protein
MGSPNGWLLIRDWFSFPCILKEELSFKPIKVRAVGLFLHSKCGNRPSNPNQQGSWLPSQTVRMDNNTSHFNLQ